MSDYLEGYFKGYEFGYRMGRTDEKHGFNLEPDISKPENEVHKFECHQCEARFEGTVAEALKAKWELAGDFKTAFCPDWRHAEEK